jgi:hypothetical protein
MGWSPSAEDPRVSAARENLLLELAEVAGEIPGDRWVLTQRIRYLGDLGRWAEAEALVGTCQTPEPWWCPALRGYVLHRSGQALEAGDAFQLALEVMGEGAAGRWRDPSVLLEYSAAKWLREPDGLTRDEALERFWNLADPLYITPGNERLTEHFARRFGVFLYSDAVLTLGLPWGRSLEELLVRYGFTAGWERTWPGMQETAGGSVVEHHHPESRGLLPPLEALEDPGGLPKGVWFPEDDRPRSTSAPILAPLVVVGKAQTAIFRRGSDLLVVAAYAPPADTLLERRRGADNGGAGQGPPPYPPVSWEPDAGEASEDTLSGLFLLAETGAWAPRGAFSKGGNGVLQLTAPSGGYLLSLEMWSPAGRWGSRVRHGIRGEAIPEDVPSVSDVILLAPGGALPMELTDALPRMLPEDAWAVGRSITVGWEVYGLGRRGEPLTFHLSLLEEEGSLIRRALKRIGLMNRAPALTLSWNEAGSEEIGPLFRAVELDLPDLEPGRYVFKLVMDIPNRSSVESYRRLTLF